MELDVSNVLKQIKWLKSDMYLETDVGIYYAHWQLYCTNKKKVDVYI